MHAVVIYESLTGNTRKASNAIAAGLRSRGIEAVACPIDRVDLHALQQADLVVVGGWVDGLLFVGQRPGRAGRFKQMPALAGKRTVVFMTYAIDAGKALDKLSAVVAARGADVVGGMTIRRDRLEQGVADLVDRLADLTLPA